MRRGEASAPQNDHIPRKKGVLFLAADLAVRRLFGAS